ncbi:type I polyketide synthase [Bradyrhizobium sp. 521_C7_N1_3]|uniref:type I polyketide synthase n=1 Tax=Bradyrhizobium sp. 521_C7_N1_3 TaxID=3240368 RepID=UPI003F8B0CA0
MRIKRSSVDIAIIGMSCRFPGAASIEEYWQNLCDGVESITFFSDQQLLAAGADPALISNPGYVKAAPILRDVETFDAAFFGYSPKDAALMDPQQRLFLEVSWEAFENAGYDPADCPGRIGVLSTAGGVVTSYLLAKLHHSELPGQTASIAHINNDKDFLSTRVSFKFNLRGPSFTVASACSSSLLAIHQACQNLRCGECEMMLAGGSVVRVPQVAGYLAEKRNLHSLDGHCRPFDSIGQGTIFGSGVGAVVLKPLERALADRDHIFAVIKGTAANNDGSGKSSYTAPSLGQQSQAVVDALESAGVSADSVGYVECHSTGTIVGDPLEVEALTLAFRQGSQRRQFCAVGSVKGNIGHPEQAAGIAGIIKAALALHHKKIPPSINYQVPNPAIDFASSPFYVNTALTDFQVAATPRRAGLNSLGIGGTNVFAILEEAPPAGGTDNQPQDLPCLVTLSAKNADALMARVTQLLHWLDEHPDVAIGDVCYTTNISRSQFAFRVAAPVRSVPELKERLAAWLGMTRERAVRVTPASSPRVAFLFSGQGSQHAGMTAQLYRTQPAFRNAMDHCHSLAQPHLEQGLLDVIFAEGGENALVNRTDYTQPALFAVEYALAELLKSWGIVPDAVIGHSLGEFAAAHAAGVVPLEDMMRLVIARGALMHALPGGGAMVSIMANESVVRPILDSLAPGIVVAAMNGPLNTVVSGDRNGMRPLTEELDRQGINYQQLRISNGFHSARIDPILDDLENIAGQIRHDPPRVALISNLTGELMSAAPDKSYWRRHTREAVRFGDGMLALAKLECHTFLEIGPHPVLLPLAQAALSSEDRSSSWIATLNRQKSDTEAISGMLAALYLAGHKIDWAAVHAGASWRRVPLPTYPFQRKRYWIEDNPIHTGRSANSVERLHPLVGNRTNSAAQEVRYEARYGVQHAPYFSDHRVAGTVVLPTTAVLEAATAVGRMHFGTPHISFDHAMHHQAMSFANGEERVARIHLTPLTSDRLGFKLLSAAIDDPEIWHTHMTGTLCKSEVPPRSSFPVQQIRSRCRQARPVANLYSELARLGLEYGPAFRGVQEAYIGQHEALVKVRLSNDLSRTEYLMHPAFLDACLHAYPLVLDNAPAGKVNGAGRSCYLPVSLERYHCYQEGISQAWVHITLRNAEKDNTQVVDIQVYDDAEQRVAVLEGLAVRLLPLDNLQLPRSGIDDLFYRAVWRKKPRGPVDVEARSPASWVIFADAKGVGEALAARLGDAGHSCHLVYRDDSFAHQGPRTWTVNELQPHGVDQLFERFAAVETLPCHGVVYLWGLDVPRLEALTLAGLKRGSEMMCRGALAILGALNETRSTSPPGRRLWFVTAGTQTTQRSGQHVDPVQAPLWGLGRTIAIEYPGLWGGLIDLQPDGDRATAISYLAAELLHPDGETQVAISPGGDRNVLRLVKQPLAELPAQAPRIRDDATYLVTGGLGMLGRSIAKWLIRKGAKYLVLTGRTASSTAVQNIFTAAEIDGAAVHVIAADIGCDDEVRRLIATIGSELPSLKGVVHAAGVLDDGILAQLDWDRFEPLFEPRVYGSFLLNKYTSSLDLDFFILQSSLLSLLGSAGQGNYTASSAFLDSLAAHRRAELQHATAINWCAWSGGGLATVSGARGEAMWSSLGARFISPDVGMQAFDKLMNRDVDQIAVADFDWPAYAGKVGRSPFLTEVLDQTAIFESPIPARNQVAESSTAVSGQAHRQLLGRVQRHIMAELGFTEVLDPNERLNDLGVDSLRSVALSNSLEREFGIPVSVADIIKGPTIIQLVDSMFGESIEPATGPDQVTAAVPDVIRLGAEIDKSASRAGASVSNGWTEVLNNTETFGSSLFAPTPPAASPVAGRGETRQRFLSRLQHHITTELGFTEAIDPDEPLNDLGVDSLMSVTLSNSLEKAFGFPVSVAELIRGPTINQLADNLTDMFAGNLPDETAEAHSPVKPAVVRAVVASTGTTFDGIPSTGAGIRSAHDQYQAGATLQRVTGRRAAEPAAAKGAGKNGRDDFRQHVASQSGSQADTVHNSILLSRPAREAVAVAGKWLIAPRPNPNARARLFCFPFAGGGLVSFRAWPQLLGDAVEVVAVEAPGRGTRIHETAVDDLGTFVELLLPEMAAWLDRPAAFFGHCLGGLTMFATLCALPEASVRFVKHSFACGIRPPHLLKQRGEFEDNLAFEVMLDRDVDIRLPFYSQTDEIFANIIRRFDTPAADRMLGIAKLRKTLLPTIRAEFKMAYDYEYQPVEPFAFPISSFVGTSDPWVSIKDSAGWQNFTRSGFINHVRQGSHFLMADDEDFILETIRDEIATALS